MIQELFSQRHQQVQHQALLADQRILILMELASIRNQEHSVLHELIPVCNTVNIIEVKTINSILAHIKVKFMTG